MFAETIAPHHEFRHIPDGSPDYNESTYYNFACPGSGLVGWLRIAVQPNRSAGQATALVFLPSGPALFAFERATAVDADALAVGGVRVEVSQPHRRQRLSFDGSMSAFADPRVLGDPAAAFRAAPRERTRITLAVTGAGRSFGSNGDDPAHRLEETLATGHYEQFTRIDGEVRIGDRVHPVRGGGLRDHSWGPRDWSGPLCHRWVSASFEDGSAVMALHVGRRDGTVTRRAATVAGGVAAEASLADLSVEWTPDGFCRGVVCRVGPAGPTLTGVARQPERFVPLRHVTEGADGQRLVTRIGYAAYDFVTDDGRRGVGIVEMLDQLIDGLPIGMACRAHRVRG
jgi:hypothetical protein